MGMQMIRGWGTPPHRSMGFGWEPSSFTSMRNQAPELSLPLFVRLWVSVKQTNLNHLLLAVDPVLIGWLCNMEAVVITNISIKYGLIPSRYIPRGMGLPKKSRKSRTGLFMGRPGNVFVTDDLLPLLWRTNTETHPHAVSSRNEVSGWHRKLVWVPEMSGFWLHWFRLIAPSYSFHPPHFPLTTAVLCQWGHRLTQQSHNAVLSIIC